MSWPQILIFVLIGYVFGRVHQMNIITKRELWPIVRPKPRLKFINAKPRWSWLRGNRGREG